MGDVGKGEKAIRALVLQVRTDLEVSPTHLVRLVPFIKEEVVDKPVEVAVEKQLHAPCPHTRDRIINWGEIVMHEIHPQLVEIAVPSVGYVVIRWFLRQAPHSAVRLIIR